MNYQCTVFKNQFDNKTHRRYRVSSWDKFVELLEGLSKLPGQKGGRNSSPLICPSVFLDGETRSNKATKYWAGWAAVDVDEHDFEPDLDKLKEALISEYGELDFVVYSTASSKTDHLKFRIVFRLNNYVEADKIKAFWFALNTHLGDIGDPQTKDLSRMYYVPAQYPNAYNFFFSHNGGDSIDVQKLIDKYPYVEKTGNSFMDRLPKEVQDALIQHRKDQLENTNFVWTSYHDCPFWPKRLAAEYTQISETGWYHKMYQIMVALAGRAIEKGYPISAAQISEMCKQFDLETGNWYENRPLTVEADRALEFIYRNG